MDLPQLPKGYALEDAHPGQALAVVLPYFHDPFTAIAHEPIKRGDLVELCEVSAEPARTSGFYSRVWVKARDE